METLANQGAYETLGLRPGASIDEVRRAYRALVKSWHPDRFVACPQRQAEATALLREFNAAYALLLNLEQRRRREPDPGPSPGNVRTRTAPTTRSTRQRARRHGPPAAASRRRSVDAVPRRHLGATDADGAATYRPDGFSPPGVSWRAIAFVCCVLVLGLLALGDPTVAQVLDYLDTAPALGD
jgi:curved DNA-binding protein CbpA